MKSDQDRHAEFMRTAFRALTPHGLVTDVWPGTVLGLVGRSAELADLMLAEHLKRFPARPFIGKDDMAPEIAGTYADLRLALARLARVHTRGFTDGTDGFVIEMSAPTPHPHRGLQEYMEAWGVVRRYLGLAVEPEEKK